MEVRSAPVARARPGGAQTRVGPSWDVNRWVIPNLQQSRLEFSETDHKTFGFSVRALPTRRDRNEQLGDELSSAAGRSSGLAGRCCWSHAASSAPTVRYLRPVLLSWLLGETYSCSHSSTLPPSCFPAITKLFPAQIDMAEQFVLCCRT